MNYLKKLICVILSLCMMSALSVGIVPEVFAEDEIKTLGSWHTGDNVKTVESGAYPAVEFGEINYNTNAIYMLSYKIKVPEGTNGTISVYGNNIPASFGLYLPGQGFEGAYYREDGDVKPKFSSRNENLKTVDTWYTVETEWCEISDNKYMKYTIKDEKGEMLAYSDKISGLWTDNWDGRPEGCESILPTAIYIYNLSNSAIQVKDIIIKETESKEQSKPTPDEPDQAGVKTLGTWYADGNVWTINSGAYPIIEFGKLNYNSAAVHMLSYTIKAPEGTANAVHVYDTNTISWGHYIPGQGFEGAYYKDGNETKPKFNANDESLKAVDTWYTVETEWCESMDNRYMKYTIKNEDGDVLAQSDKIAGLWKDAYYAESDEFFGDAMPLGIIAWNNETGKTIEIKDIIFKEIETETPEPDDPIVLVDNMDFTGCSTVADARRLGLVINSSENVSISSAYEGDSLSPSLCINRADNGVNLTTFADGAYEGIYNISYWVYTEGVDTYFIVDAPMKMNGFEDGSLMLLEVRDNLASVNPNFGDGQRGTTIAPLREKAWYRFEHTIDVNARMVTTKAFDENNSPIGNVINRKFTNMTSDYSAELINHFSGIRFRNWKDVGTLIDNISIRREFITPRLTEENISFITADGAEIGYMKEVGPAVKSIVLDFGTAITDESAKNGIHLTKGDGTEVSFKGEKDKTKYFMNFEQLLEPNQTYTLTVEYIENEIGTQISGNLSTTFTTGDGSISAKISSICENGTVLEDTPPTVGGQLTVNIEYINSLLTEQNIDCVVSYYDENNRTIETAVHKITAPASTGNSLEISSKAIPENCASVKAVLWRDLESMISYEGYIADSAVKGGIEYGKECDFSKEQFEIYGELKDEKDTDGLVTIQVLKSGMSFDGLNGKTDKEKEEAILYIGQQKADPTTGRFSFTIGYNEEDMPIQTAKALQHEVRVVGNHGAYVQNITVNLAPKSVYAETVNKINTLAANSAISDEEFAAELKSELDNLGLNSAPLEENELNSDTLKAYRKHLAEDAASAEAMIDNVNIFTDFMILEAAKKNASIDLGKYKDRIYQTEAGLIKAYDSVVKNEEIKKYFEEKFVETLKSSETSTLNEFTKAWKIAVILTNARYGDGYGAFKAALLAYGSEIGITQTKSDSVYQKLFRKDYTADSLKDAFDAAADDKSQGGGNHGSGGRGSSGGGGTSNNISGEYLIPGGNTQNIAPIRKSFADIDSVEWASEAILALADKGIVDGVEENVFKPNNAVTREEFVKILVGAMGLSNSDYINNFSDVKDDDWFCSWVNIAYENGICSGIGNDCFGVGSKLTRQDMVVLLNNSLCLKGVDLPNTGELIFDDKDDIADYARTAVSNMTAIGVVSGISETEFSPMGEATRAQAATIIYRALDMLQ